MKKICFIVILLFTFFSLRSQSVDSLFNLVENHKNKDAEYLSLVGEYCKSKLAENLSSKDVALLKEGVVLSEQLGLDGKLAETHNILGWYYMYKSNLKDALIHLQKASDLLEKVNN